ncbi:DNA topoisomerase I [Candidatus Bathyarchaeota archaeon]|nr:MAG: DNA topoisomerase I [Candidatus Bathyarchaeota archaeon]
MASRHTLIIAEKPDAAERIASALSNGNGLKKKFERKIPYFEFEKDGKKVFVVPASGHVYTVTQIRGGRNYYPVFTFQWAPKYLVERGAKRTRNIINLFRKLSKSADEFINASDYDIEGSLIGYTILKYACEGKEKQAKRMKFSTLTKEELIYAYENLMPCLDFELVEAGMTRHEVDWLYGINLSRALTLSAVKQNGKYTTLSVGRVQGPTLHFIVQREVEIRSFVPVPYWEIKAIAEIDGKDYELKFEKDRIGRKVEAEEIVKKCSGRFGKVVSIEEKEFRRFPPEPFDLGSLQREAYRFFGFTPRRTLDVAERLYLNALISYPRTSSQKLPPTINYRGILQNLLKNEKYEKNAKILLSEKELKPREGKKEDPAHPAIYPTGTPPEKELTVDEAKIYDLIVRRFMATFGKPAVRLSTKVTVESNGYTFFLHGGRIIYEGWMAFYHPYVEVGEVILPVLKVDQEILLKKVDYLTKFTEPPPRYNPASLLRLMEENNIGTKATRAEIIDTLYERGYVRDERMVATDIGFAVVETLNKYCPEIISVEMTRRLEEKMEKIENGDEKRENVLVDAVDQLRPVLDRLKTVEKEVGSDLSQAIQIEFLRKRIVGTCPKCGTGKLMILRSRKTSKRFIGCTNFFVGKCKMALPLPQKAGVQTTEKTCKTCGWPIIVIKPFKRRRFEVCINPRCPSKQQKTN